MHCLVFNDLAKGVEDLGVNFMKTLGTSWTPGSPVEPSWMDADRADAPWPSSCTASAGLTSRNITLKIKHIDAGKTKPIGVSLYGSTLRVHNKEQT